MGTSDEMPLKGAEVLRLKQMERGIIAILGSGPIIIWVASRRRRGQQLTSGKNTTRPPEMEGRGIENRSVGPKVDKGHHSVKTKPLPSKVPTAD